MDTNPADWSSAAGQIFQILQQNDIGTIILSIGICLTGVGCAIAFKVLGLPPNDTKPWHKIFLFSSFIVGVILVFSGTISTFYAKIRELREQAVISKDAAFEQLKDNARVSLLIRLIPHNKENPNSPNYGGLELKDIPQLGPKNQEYTFVADYGDLEGQTAAQAARMMGLNIANDDSISAIIFPLLGRKIIPVNARGLLEVIDSAESESNVSPKFNVSARLSGDAFSALAWQNDVQAWSYDNYKQYYQTYCTVAMTFRCERWPIASAIGQISDDWNPLGFARTRPVTGPPPCQQIPEICGIQNWDDARSKYTSDFGARVFLTRNAQIDSLKGRIMIDFDRPDKERLPFIDAGDYFQP